ncbi:hypothetical protein HMPREF0868_0215 [Mageeibacillus indolicus UPII9-5]|uniref:Uncharacterized protein n=1 Tax=Mageeibacillus indolicus (strain UPII9-5) TaxID=699246 RepID=D3R048_MAGIU|nr:hypothetical protein HMPREF0868_0215 [Mageeibacillus indolicus UPII9-5]
MTDVATGTGPVVDPKLYTPRPRSLPSPVSLPIPGRIIRVKEERIVIKENITALLKFERTSSFDATIRHPTYVTINML